MRGHAGTSETERRRVRGRRLTDRQALILDLVADGLENKEIAHRLGLSEQAIKEHVSALLHRLAARNRAALAEIATELKIVGTMDLEPEWLDYVFQRSPVMKAIVRGPDHIFVAANEAYRRAAGEREIIGLPFREVFPGSTAVGGLAALDEVYASGEPQVLHDFRGQWGPPGSQPDRYAEVSLQPLPGPEGVAGISIIAVDVTDSVRAREQLAEMSAEQLAMFDLVPSGIVVLDRMGAVVKVNRAAQALLGPGPYRAIAEAAKDYQLRDAATGREFAPVEEALRRTLAGEAVRDLRIRMYLPRLRRDAVVRIDATPLRTVQGDVRAVVAAVTELVEDSRAG